MNIFTQVFRSYLTLFNAKKCKCFHLYYFTWNFAINKNAILVYLTKQSVAHRHRETRDETNKKYHRQKRRPLYPHWFWKNCLVLHWRPLYLCSYLWPKTLPRFPKIRSTRNNVWYQFLSSQSPVFSQPCCHTRRFPIFQS